MTGNTQTLVEIFHETTRLDIHELTRRLNNHLGATAVAILAGSRDAKLPYRWAKESGPIPNESSQNRLRTAHRVWGMIADAESDHTARTWFVGLNPLLNEISPLMALRDDRLKEVIDAAKAFVDGTWTA